MRNKLTDEHKEFIRNEGKSWSGTQLSKKLGYSSSMITRWRRENGLQLTKEEVVKHRADSMKGKTTFTPEMDAIIKEHYLTTPIKTIAAMIGRSYTGVMGALKRMGLELPKELREQRKEIGMYRKGQTPPNKGKKQVDYMSPDAIARCSKTRFKKGNVPHNTYDKDGIVNIRIDSTGIPYMYIRVSLGNWELYHRYLWEQANGKVPAGHCLWFKDGDSTNVKLENLECITRKENRLRNKRSASYSPELKEAIKAQKDLLLTIKKVKKDGKQRTDNSQE